MSYLPASEIETYNRAAGSLFGLIRGEQFASRSQATRRQRANAKLRRIRMILGVLGDPQLRYPVVHVTGTSGKGSTAAMVSAVLTAAGYRVGLRTSPYLQVATEKLQIGTSLIDTASFDQAVSRVLEEASKYDPSHPFSYAEAWSVMGYWWFAERHVDIAIVEVGAGGRFDPTNVIDPVVSVITSVGLDHVVTLGPTISDIAWHKAGVIKPGGTAILGDISGDALAVITREANASGARIVHACPSSASKRSLPPGAATFQRRNADVAAAVVRALHEHGFDPSDSAIIEGIRATRLPGRLELMPGETDSRIWIDGAHNSDKIEALVREIPLISQEGPLPVIVLGLLDTKDPVSIVSRLRQAASALVLTEPRVIGRQSLKASYIRDFVLADNFGGAVHAEPIPELAVRRAEDLAKSGGTTVLVTGSMYLAGEVRRRWYRDEDIVVQRTPWPGQKGAAYAFPERSVAL